MTNMKSSLLSYKLHASTMNIDQTSVGQLRTDSSFQLLLSENKCEVLRSEAQVPALGPLGSNRLAIKKVKLVGHMMGLITISYALTKSEGHFGWLYLPHDRGALETEGFFSRKDMSLSSAEEVEVRNKYTAHGWSPSLSAADIEDVVENCRMQVERPSDQELFDAFMFFLKNDAFKEW